MPQSDDKTPAKPGDPNDDDALSNVGTQAIEDDLLIDVTQVADDVGLEWPAAMTVAARAECAAWSHAGDHRDSSHYRSFRLWDVLSIAAAALRSTGVAKPDLLINLQRLPSDENQINNQKLALKLVFDLKENGEPVVIIMLPEQN